MTSEQVEKDRQWIQKIGFIGYRLTAHRNRNTKESVGPGYRFQTDRIIMKREEKHKIRINILKKSKKRNYEKTRNHYFHHLNISKRDFLKIVSGERYPVVAQ